MRHANALLAAVAAMTLGVSVLADDTSTSGTGTDNRPIGPAATHRDHRSGGNTNSSSSSQNQGQYGTQQQNQTGQQMAMTGQQSQADQQILQALHTIAQQPDQASDKLFVLMAACGNQWETEFARVVEQRAQDQQVKQLAQHIVQDHQQAQQQLQQIAQSMQMQLPSSLPSEKQAKLAVFQQMPADQLEKCFIIDNKADHAKDVTSYADHQQTVQNAELKQYTTQTLPKLQQHTQMVLQCASAKGVSTQLAGMDYDARTAGERMNSGNRNNNNNNNNSGQSAGTGPG